MMVQEQKDREIEQSLKQRFPNLMSKDMGSH